MRFAPERDHGANSGLAAAREFLEPIKAQFSWLTYSDLWTLAGVAAIQEMGGPDIPWRPGRADHDVSFCTPDGRLPDASKGQDHLRAIFYRMGVSCLVNFYKPYWSSTNYMFSSMIRRSSLFRELTLLDGAIPIDQALKDHGLSLQLL